MVDSFRVELFAWKYHPNAPGVAPCSGRAGTGPSKAGEAAAGHCASGDMVKICEGQTKDGLTSYQLVIENSGNIKMIF